MGNDTSISLERNEVRVSPGRAGSRMEGSPREGFSKRVRLLPIIFFFTYLNLTVFLFAFGPWNWPVINGTKLYVFLAFAHLALLLGYLSAAFRRPQGYCGKWKIDRIIKISLTVNLLLFLPTSAFRTGSSIPDIVQGLEDPGQVYFDSNAWRALGGHPVEYIRIFVGPLLFLLLPLSIFYWHRLKTLTKIMASLYIVAYLCMYIAIGTNKGIADFVLLFPCLIVARGCAGFFKLNRRRIIMAIAIGLTLFCLFLSFFTVGQISRAGTGRSWGYFAMTGTFADTDNFLVRYLPDQAAIGALALSSYLTQGYYALYLSLDEPFVPMFGVGNSMFLYFNAARLTGMREIVEMPYPVRLQNRGTWDAYGSWSTIYPWIASDVSFPGTILVVFLIGRLFALAWLDTLRGTNPYAVGAFAQLLIMLFYFSANNQVLQSGEALTSFYGILALWLVTRRNHVLRKA